MMQYRLARFLELLLGTLLVVAGVLKLMDPPAFGQSLAMYHLLPPALVPWVALALPPLEVATGLGLVFRRARFGARWWALVLYLAFWGAVLQAVVRGIDVSCGCFGEVSWDRTNLRKVVENTLWLLAAVYVIRFGEKRR